MRNNARSEWNSAMVENAMGTRFVPTPPAWGPAPVTMVPTSTKVETIRWYEKQGLLPRPTRTAGIYRTYSKQELVRLSFIRRVRDLGFSLDQVRALLELAVNVLRVLEDLGVDVGIVDGKEDRRDLEFHRAG